ncbi:MAG: GFA family protein [Parvibaculaceae bacterium]|nr:GFA family protein [Parvibaculaceae bacterium]
MTERVTGGCACGAIRYDAKNNIELSFQCFCRKCQRSTGGGHSSVFALATSEVTFTGELTEYTQDSDAGVNTYSGFCRTCGSPLTSRSERFPDRVYVHVATLDDPSVFQPSFTVFEEKALAWDKPNMPLAES